jgi:hypothetical protein
MGIGMVMTLVAWAVAHHHPTVTAQQIDEHHMQTIWERMYVALVNDPAYQKATQEEVTVLMQQFPLSSETRDLQEQSMQLLEQLSAGKTSAEAQPIWLHLTELEQRIQQQPDYAQMITAYRDSVHPQRYTADQQQDTHTLEHRVLLPLIIRHSSSGGGGDDGNDDPPPPVSLVLERADLILVDGTSSGGAVEWSDFLYKYEWGHTGVVEGNDLIYEANYNDGVRFRSFTTFWWKNGNRIWQARAQEELRNQVVTSLDQAYQDYGTAGTTPYNFNLLDKRTEDSFYCAQLAWRVYVNAGIDIDSNDPAYAAYVSTRFRELGPWFATLAVAPDEIYVDEDLHEVALVTVE